MVVSAKAGFTGSSLEAHSTSDTRRKEMLGPRADEILQVEELGGENRSTPTDHTNPFHNRSDQAGNADPCRKVVTSLDAQQEKRESIPRCCAAGLYLFECPTSRPTIPSCPSCRGNLSEAKNFFQPVDTLLNCSTGIMSKQRNLNMSKQQC